MLLRMDYNAWQDVLGGHIGFTNDVSNILFLFPDEIPRDNEHSESGWKPMERTEHKSHALINNLVHRSWKPGRVVQDPCVGTQSTIKARLLVGRHCCFVGCDKEVICLEKLMPSIVEAWNSQFISHASGLIGDEVQTEVVLVLMEAFKGRYMRASLDTSGIPMRCHVSRCSWGMLFLPLCCKKDYSVCEMCQSMLYKMRSE